MRRLLARFFAQLYRIPGEGFRKQLRRIIGRLEGGQAWSVTLREVEKKYYGIEIGIGTYGPCFDPEQTWTGYGNLKIGKFCSMAKGVCIYSRNHPYWNPSTSPLFYNHSFAKGAVEEDTVAYGKLEIGNDVWIGQYAIITPSCKRIGDGAVIGAGAIVTKDVPDYAIVAGNPARVLKKRFSDDEIARLKQIKWWDRDIAFLKENSHLFQNTEAFLRELGDGEQAIT